MRYDVAVIGCGIVGAAAAYELSRYNCKVLVLEANNDVANGTTKANSAILHAGYDPAPHTLMAETNVRGVKLAKELCEKLDVEREEIGSLVLAFGKEDERHLDMLYRQGLENGVPGVRLLAADEVRAMEPNVSEQVTAALYAPTAAIVSPWEFALALAETAVVNGCDLRLSAPVTGIDRLEEGYLLHTPKGDFEARYVVNAAGLHCDKVHEMVGGTGFTVHGVRGEYYIMDKSQGHVVNHVIFQCPNEKGKGVLVSPTVHGNLIVGPSADAVDDVESVANTAFGLEEVRTAAARSVPELNYRESIRNFSGVRCYTQQEDFIIEESKEAPGFINLAGIRSPGLSAAPAIAEKAVELLQGCGLHTVPKEHFTDTRKRTVFRRLSAGEKAALIKQNPLYGRVICRCETVTEGEIVEALHRPIVPTSIDAIKRRCNAGMGRCQGGFCGPRVHEIISRELGIPKEQVLMDEEGSWLLCGETKSGKGENA